jgi:cysteine desulfurase
MPRIYLDNAASTPVDPRVLRAMQPYFLKEFGNPGSLHSYGQKAIGAVDASREAIARMIGAEFREIIFTGSATEANNLALRGTVNFYKKNNASVKQPRIIVSSIEHESVLETARALENEGVDIIYLPVDKEGVVNLEAFKKALSENTILVSIMYVNNETGTVQPLQEIAKIIADHKAKNSAKNNPSKIYPLFHTDAAQAFQLFDCNIKTLGVDLMTLSAHKIYGPKGIGVLKITKELEPEITGGGQEFGLRSGTENVPAIVGFAKAMELAVEARAKETKRLSELRKMLWTGIKKIVPQAEINGSISMITSASHSPHILNIYFPGYEAQDLLVKFDRAGVAVSSGSACRSRAIEPSYVLEALGFSKERATSSIRFSFGRQTTKADIAKATKLFGSIFRSK